MKIFLGWSGTISQQIALFLKEWFPCVINATRPFLSSEDIRKGRRWLIEISKELEECDFGIICLTPENLESPWILFEAGALSKSLAQSNVCTLLTGGLRPENVKEPLSNFQHTVLTKDDFRKLVVSVNGCLKEGKLDEKTLATVFETWWPKIEGDINNVVRSTSEAPTVERNDREILIEILELTRSIAHNVGSYEPSSRDDDLHVRKLKDLLNQPISALDLSHRARSALGLMGAPTLGRTAMLEPDQMRKYHGVGDQTIKEIEGELLRHGLSLRMKIADGLLNENVEEPL